MPIKSIRFPDDLVADIEAEMKGSDRSFSWVVNRRCRADAWRGGSPIQVMPEERAPRDYSTADMREAAFDKVENTRVVSPGVRQKKPLPPGVKSARELAMERQRKMNERKG